MGKMSREKGKRFEKLIATRLRERGYDAHRSAQYRGNTGQAADVEGLPHIHIECKHTEQFRIYDYMDQAVRDSEAAGDGTPVVVYKKNNAEILVTMRFNDFMDLYEKGYGNGKE